MTAGPDVLVVVHEARRTGPPIYALALVTWLRAHTELDVQVHLLEGGPLLDAFTALGPTTVAPDPAPFDAAEVVYVNTAVSIRALRGDVRPRGPVLTHIHEMEVGLHYWLPPADRALLFARTDRFLVGPDAARDNLVRNHAVPRTRIAQVPYFAPPHPTVAPAAVADARRRLGLADDVLVVGACGVREWRKAPDLFAHLAWELDRRLLDRPVAFVWVGSPIPTGPHWDEDADRALLGLGDRLHFVEDQVELEPWLATFDVFALTSREDTFPLACLSAASLGVPPVCFDNGGIAELVAASGGGAVVPYPDVGAMADAVEALLRDDDARARAGAAVRSHVEAHHDVDRCLGAVAAELDGARG